MNGLDDARKKINEIDKEMARLFEERMNAAKQVALYKREHGLPIKDNSREQVVVDKNRVYITNPEIESYYVTYIKDVMNISCQYQDQIMSGMKVAFCGEVGAHAHNAAKKLFPSANYISFKNFDDAYKAVENGDLDCAVLPMENSYAGEIGAVMDLMFNGSLYINKVYDHPITHCLVAKEGTKASDIKAVYSHPQALSQCDKYITKHSYESNACASTSHAAKMVAESSDNTIAAICSKEAAEAFGLVLVDTDIQDSNTNTTRFACFSRIPNKSDANARNCDENFILVFSCLNEAGSLAHALNIIGSHGYNMRCLRSRPMKNLQWNYYFYVEAEGNANTEEGQAMIKELSVICEKLKLVGTYRAHNVN